METKVFDSSPETDAVAIIERLLLGGELLPEQQPRPSHWLPEKELAAAVLTDALIEVRDFLNHPLHKRKVAEDLEWIFSDDVERPFSFVRLCEVFGLEPGFVRKIVLTWLMESLVGGRQRIGRHQAAA